MSPFELLVIGCACGCAGLFGVLAILTIQEWVMRKNTLRWRHEMKRREW